MKANNKHFYGGYVLGIACGAFAVLMGGAIGGWLDKPARYAEVFQWQSEDRLDLAAENCDAPTWKPRGACYMVQDMVDDPNYAWGVRPIGEPREECP